MNRLYKLFLMVVFFFTSLSNVNAVNYESRPTRLKDFPAVFEFYTKINKKPFLSGVLTPELFVVAQNKDTKDLVGVIFVQKKDWGQNLSFIGDCYLDYSKMDDAGVEFLDYFVQQFLILFDVVTNRNKSIRLDLELGDVKHQELINYTKYDFRLNAPLKRDETQSGTVWKDVRLVRYYRPGRSAQSNPQVDGFTRSRL